LKPIPIFIISHNRLGVLQQSIESYYANIVTPIQLIIHDNASTYPPLLEYLSELEKNGATIYRHPENPPLDQMFLNVAATIADWLSKNDADFYIVTDPDVTLDCTNPDILEFYAWLLQQLPDVVVVGPMLRIDDIPEFYPKRDRVIKKHMAQFWSHLPRTVAWKRRCYHILPCPIDTTFGMYRADYPWQRWNLGIRTYAPYSAKHLDWYIDPANPSEDQVFYSQTARADIAHWGLKVLDAPQVPPQP